MTCECIIALVTCVATIITTVIAVLSYLHDRKEQKVKPPFRETVAALFTTLWRRPTESGISISFNIPPTCFFVKSIAILSE